MARIAKDEKAFVEQVVKTRNYLTHLDRKDRKGSLLGDEDLGDLWLGNAKLSAIAAIHMLKQLGIDEQTAASGVFRTLPIQREQMPLKSD